MSWLPANVARLFRGSSGDELDAADARRSAHSTPRMSRARIRDVTPTQQQRHFGSLGDMEIHRVNPPVNRARERSWESERLHSVTQPVHPSQQALLNRSYDMDRPPPGIQGLDRAWEVERARGLEMLHRSAEKERERRIAQAHTQAQNQRSKDSNKQSKKRKKDRKKDSQTMMEQIDNNKLEQERLERRIDELNRMLLEEKHGNRKDKLAVAKLQQEVARQKSERSIRETLTKEFEREKMLRIETERKLQMVSLENDNNQARLQALHAEFQKMEEMVRSLLQFKNKVDQLKQEKATLSINFEKNMQKYRTEISHLEHENKIVMAELKRLEQQCVNCEQCNKDLSYRVTKNDQSEHSDKVKMLLERLKRLEEEKSQLVLENERQRQNYEKCLDEIANQVVQALLSQKGLREECGKLQKRVLDLEDQNRQLRDMFHQRLKFNSDSVLQGACAKSATEQLGGMQGKEAVMSASCDSITPLSHISLGSLHSICSNYQETAHIEDNDPGKPKPSSPPPWLRDQIVNSDSSSNSQCSPATVETALSAGSSHGNAAQAQRAFHEHMSKMSQQNGALENGGKPATGGAGLHRLLLHHGGINSAFHPVTSSHGPHSLTNQNPSTNHVTLAVANKNTQIKGQIPIQMHMSQNSTFINPQTYPRLPSTVEPPSPAVSIDSYSPSEVDYQIINSIQNAKKRFSQSHLPQVKSASRKSSISSESKQSEEKCGEKQNGADLSDPQKEGEQSKSADTGAESERYAASDVTLPRNEGQAVMSQSMEQPRPKPIRLHLASSSVGTTPTKPHCDTSPGKELLKMSDSFPDKFTLNDKDGMPKISEFCDSDSDESSTSKALSNNFSMASTLSLTEVLERGLDKMKTPNDETFSLDTFQMFDSEDEAVFEQSDAAEVKKSTEVTSSKTGSHVANLNGSRFLVNLRKNEKSEVDYGDYVCLRKIREYVYVNMPDLMGGGGLKQGHGFKDMCKASQTSPELEEICDCGSCDRLYQEKQALKHNSNPYASSPQLIHRPQYLQLNLKATASPHYESPVSAHQQESRTPSSISRNSTPSTVQSRSRFTSARESDYVNLTPAAIKYREGDYVNITPERVQRILSTSSEHSKLDSASVTPVQTAPNLGVWAKDKKKTPPPTKPKPVRLNCDVRAQPLAMAECDKAKGSDGNDVLSTGSSCCSPDSAMHKSYTSTESGDTERTENRTLERLRYGRDEGYSSNSANSIKTESENASAKVSTSSSKDAVNDTNANNNNTTKTQSETVGARSAERRVRVEAEVHARYDKTFRSQTSLHSVPSVECVGKERDIREYLGTHLANQNTAAGVVLANSRARPSSRTSLLHQRSQDSDASERQQQPAAKPSHPAALTLTFCSRSHRLKRSHSTSCCYVKRAISQIQSCILKSSFSDVNLRKTVMCVKATQYVRQMAILAKQLDMDKATRMSHVRVPNAASPGKVLPRSQMYPIYENVSPPYSQSPATSSHSNRNATPIVTHSNRPGQCNTNQTAVTSTRPTQCGSHSNHMTAPVTPGAYTVYGNRQYRSAQHCQAKLKMGISSTVKGEVADERRVEGSEIGYQSRDELIQAEGTVTSQYEEAPPETMHDVIPEHTTQLFFNVTPRDCSKPSRHQAPAFKRRKRRSEQNNHTNSHPHSKQNQQIQDKPRSPDHLDRLATRQFNQNHGENNQFFKLEGYSTVAADPAFGNAVERRYVSSDGDCGASRGDVPRLGRSLKPEVVDRASNHVLSCQSSSQAVLNRRGCYSMEGIRKRSDNEGSTRTDGETNGTDTSDPEITARILDLEKTVDEMQRSVSRLDSDGREGGEMPCAKRKSETVKDESLPENNEHLEAIVEKFETMARLMELDVVSDDVTDDVTFRSTRSDSDEESFVDCPTDDDVSDCLGSDGGERAVVTERTSQDDPLCHNSQTRHKGQGRCEVNEQGHLPENGKCQLSGDKKQHGTVNIGSCKGHGQRHFGEEKSKVSQEQGEAEVREARSKISAVDQSGHVDEGKRGFLESLVLFSSSSSEEEEDENLTQQSWSQVSATDKLDDSVSHSSPFSLATDLSPSPTRPDPKPDITNATLTQLSPTSFYAPGTFNSRDDSPKLRGKLQSISENADLSSAEEHETHVGNGAGDNTGLDDVSDNEPLSSDDSSSSDCQCEDEEQCPHIHHFTISQFDTSSSYQTDTSDQSVSYFFEPPLHPRVSELKEENRLENEVVRRVSNANIEPSNQYFKTVLSSNLEAKNFDEDKAGVQTADDLGSDLGEASDLEKSPIFSRVCRLRFGARSGSFDSVNSSVGIDGISLSDSCCESADDVNCTE